MATTIPSSTLAKPLRGEIGVSGTNIYGGYIRGEEYARDLIGRSALINYDIMRRTDAATHTALEVYKAPIESANWSVVSASEDPADVEQADLVKRELFDRNIDFHAVLREIMTFLEFGHSVFELVYSDDLVDFNGKLIHGLDKLASRKQLTIMRWETSDHQPGITQIAPYSTPAVRDIYMPKLVIFTNEKEGENYEGISMLRFARKHFILKDKLELMNAVALERMAMGIPVVKKGLNNTNVDPQALEELRILMRKIYANEESYLEVPEGIDVSMLDMQARQTKEVLPTLNYEDTMIMLSAFASFLLLGTNGNSGSNALTSDLSRFLMNNLQSKARIIETGINSVIKRLIDINYTQPPKNGYPKIQCTDISDENVTELATAVKNFMDAGALRPGRDVENRVRKPLGLKEVSQEEWDQAQDEQNQKDQQAQEVALKAAQQQPKNHQDNADVPPADNPAKDGEAVSNDDAKAERMAALEREVMALIAEG
jgi:hypothetical protein